MAWAILPVMDGMAKFLSILSYFFVNFHSSSGAGAKMEQGKNYLMLMPCSENWAII